MSGYHVQLATFSLIKFTGPARSRRWADSCAAQTLAPGPRRDASARSARGDGVALPLVPLPAPPAM
jgi:hypothetical protein